MKSRMERYDSQQKNKKNIVLRREDKNQGLYDGFYTNNSTYTEYQGFDDKNVVDLSMLNKNYHTREEYQKIKEYKDVVASPKVKRDLDHFESLYPTDENRVYDINNILMEAKKNRNQVDELEKKRKLRNTQYNILNNLDLKQLKNYRENKSEEEEIQELIDTITSKSLRKKINEEVEKDLMSDLLPNENDETIVTEPISMSEEVHSDSSEEKNKVSPVDDIDRSFYTKSMDLSDQDFEMDNEFEDINQKTIPPVVKVFLFILLIGIMSTIVYFVIKFI